MREAGPWKTCGAPGASAVSDGDAVTASRNASSSLGLCPDCSEADASTYVRWEDVGSSTPQPFASQDLPASSRAEAGPLGGDVCGGLSRSVQITKPGPRAGSHLGGAGGWGTSDRAAGGQSHQDGREGRLSAQLARPGGTPDLDAARWRPPESQRRSVGRVACGATELTEKETARCRSRCRCRRCWSV